MSEGSSICFRAGGECRDEGATERFEGESEEGCRESDGDKAGTPETGLEGGGGGGSKVRSIGRLVTEALVHRVAEDDKFVEGGGSIEVVNGSPLEGLAVHGARVAMSKPARLLGVRVATDEGLPASEVHSRRPPTGICCTTTRLPSTSA